MKNYFQTEVPFGRKNPQRVSITVDKIIPENSIVWMSRPSMFKEEGSNSWKWHLVKMELYDDVESSASHAMENYKTKPVKLNIFIKLYGTIGEVIEEWNINGAEIIDISYSDIGNVERHDGGIVLKIKIENATLKYI